MQYEIGSISSFLSAAKPASESASSSQVVSAVDLSSSSTSAPTSIKSGGKSSKKRHKQKEDTEQDAAVAPGAPLAAIFSASTLDSFARVTKNEDSRDRRIKKGSSSEDAAGKGKGSRKVRARSSTDSDGNELDLVQKRKLRKEERRAEKQRLDGVNPTPSATRRPPSNSNSAGNGNGSESIDKNAPAVHKVGTATVEGVNFSTSRNSSEKREFNDEDSIEGEEDRLGDEIDDPEADVSDDDDDERASRGRTGTPGSRGISTSQGDRERKVTESNVEEIGADLGAGLGKEKANGMVDRSEQNSRTIFIGNIPLKGSSQRSVARLCERYGAVESVRLRSVPVAGAKVDDAGNQDLVRKVCVNSKRFGDQKGSCNAYVVFREAGSVEAALAEALQTVEGEAEEEEGEEVVGDRYSDHGEDEDKGAGMNEEVSLRAGKRLGGLNNLLLGGRHLRVDRATPTLFEPQLTVFLGALPHYADEEELRAHFAEVLPGGQRDIASIRLVRDPQTLVGKGIGYLMLKTRDAVMAALSLHQKKFKKRWELRVSLCGKRTKSANFKARGTSPGPISGNKRPRDSEGDASSAGREAIIGDDEPNRREKRPKKQKVLDGAMRRINLKSVSTKKQVQKAKSKGKRLGGVVKRAIKSVSKKGASAVKNAKVKK